MYIQGRPLNVNNEAECLIGKTVKGKVKKQFHLGPEPENTEENTLLIGLLIFFYITTLKEMNVPCLKKALILLKFL